MQGTTRYHTCHILPSINQHVDSATRLRYAECSRATGYIIKDMVTRCRLLTAHGARSCLSVRTQPRPQPHWCTFTDLYHTIYTIHPSLRGARELMRSPTPFTSLHFRGTWWGEGI